MSIISDTADGCDKYTIQLYHHIGVVVIVVYWTSGDQICYVAGAVALMVPLCLLAFANLQQRTKIHWRHQPTAAHQNTLTSQLPAAHQNTLTSPKQKWRLQKLSWIIIVISSKVTINIDIIKNIHLIEMVQHISFQPSDVIKKWVNFVISSKTSLKSLNYNASDVQDTVIFNIMLEK